MTSHHDPMSRQLRRALAALFGRLQTAVAPPAPRSAARAAKPIEPDAFPQALLEQLRKSGSVLAGRVQLIGLEKVRDSLGNRWEEKRDHVLSIATQIIKEQMASPDYWRAVGEASFLLVFARASRAEAELRTATMLDRIHRRLLGEGAPFDQIEVKTLVVEVDGRVAFREVDAVEILTRALAEEERAAQVVPAPTGADPLMPPSLRFRYRPIWQVRQGVVDTYQCVAEAVLPDGRLLRDYRVLPGGLRSSLVSELDERGLKRAVADLTELARAAPDGLPTVAVTVHCRTLETPAARQAYLKLCNEIPEKLRQHLVFEVAALPAFAPESRVHNFAFLLRAFSRALVLRVQEPNQYPASLRALGIHALCLALDEVPGVAETDPDGFDTLVRFHSASRRSGCATVARGLGSTRLAAAALAAGFDFLAGEALLGMHEKPGAVEKYTLNDFEMLAATAMDAKKLIAAGNWKKSQ
ncbi:EAL domain-containing protein [Desertibaculum subflavum]|uniref:EAL domain-containing protein n=1 Tax=Desertibaculum subflavum TaxID=2268458 RepID=UPI000E660911